MARTQEAMAKVKPEIAKLNERFKNDLVAKQQAQMELYRKHGVNPAAGLGGCLMLFLQMPIFLGLYFALQESFFFRLESFLWIKNLTRPGHALLVDRSRSRTSATRRHWARSSTSGRISTCCRAGR